MSLINISAHTRGNKNGQVSVQSYMQNRKDGKKKNKKGQTKCQQMIAHVIKLNNKYNATPEQLRTDPLWRNYVCNCPESTHYKWITGQEGFSEAGNGIQATPTDWEGQAPNWRGKGTHKVVIKARIINVPARTVQSRCGVGIFIPAHKRTLQGKSIAYLVSR